MIVRSRTSLTRLRFLCGLILLTTSPHHTNAQRNFRNHPGVNMAQERYHKAHTCAAWR